MTYNPLSREQQERRRKLEHALPFVLMSVIMLTVMGWTIYHDSKSAHPKPKPEQLSYAGRPCKGTDCREAIAAAIATDPPFMPQCNDGQYVTDLGDCPEYRDWKGHVQGWDHLHYAFTQRTRKHKRTTTATALTLGTLTSSAITIGTGLTLSQETPTYVFSDCERGVSGTSGPGYSNMVAECNGGKVQLNWKETPPAGASTLPGLTWSTTSIPADGWSEEKAAEYDQLALDHSEDFYDNVFVPGEPCTDRELYRELQCVSGGTCKKRNEKATWCPAGVLLQPKKPDCKMPADIDVCPAQQLDPKKSHD